MVKNRISLFLLVLIAGLLAFALRNHAQLGRKPVITRTELLLGTIVDITISDYEDVSGAGKAVEAAFREIRRVEAVFSAYKDESITSRLNHLAKGEMLTVDDEVLYIIQRAQAISYNSKGAFDITVAPLCQLWLAAKKKGEIPKQEEIRRALSVVGSQFLLIDEGRKRVGLAKNGMRVDFGGIVKGYAVERAIAVLKDRGIASAIVNAGGDLFCLGRKNSNTPWKVGIRNPDNKRALIGELTIENEAVSTSGGYEQYVMIGDRKFSHIIDPRTGLPSGESPASVTVIAEEPLLSDALATGISVAGVSEGLAFVNALEGVEAVIITRENGSLRIHVSSGLRERYDFKER